MLAGLFIRSAAFYISASTAFVALLLGFLFIPPALRVSAALVQGASMLSKCILETEREDLVIFF